MPFLCINDMLEASNTYISNQADRIDSGSGEGRGPAAAVTMATGLIVADDGSESRMVTKRALFPEPAAATAHDESLIRYQHICKHRQEQICGAQLAQQTASRRVDEELEDIKETAAARTEQSNLNKFEEQDALCMQGTTNQSERDISSS